MKLIYPYTLAILFFSIVVMPSVSFAQKYKSDSCYVHFFSDAPMEDIEATNLDGQSAFDLETGEIVFSIPIKSFEFEKSLMQEHFNENYLESDKYPKATFIGKLTGFSKSIATRQQATAAGIMKIHGVEQQISVEGELMIRDGFAEIHCQFPIELSDYKVKIPKVVFYNIAEVVDVTIKFTYEKVE
jgi:polyisoprenoid-binding protein YceI